MTCEVAVLNLQAIALAADSASTVRRWVGGKEEVRYFKGSNKIFQLSNHQPVGLMVFDSATLEEIPWEIILKDYRAALGDKSFNDLAGYASDLFQWLQDNLQFFPEEQREKIFKADVMKVAGASLYWSTQDHKFKAADTDAKRKAFYDAQFIEWDTGLQAEPLPEGFNNEDVAAAIEAHRVAVEADIQAVINTQPELTPAVNTKRLYELSVLTSVKRYSRFKAHTGMVVAGYGDAAHFPGFCEYDCFGLVLKKLVYKHVASQQLGVGRTSHIKAFATTSMVHTFLMGVSPDVYATVTTETRKSLVALADKIRADMHLDEIPGLGATIDGMVTACTNAWADAAYDAHFHPLMPVLASLPVDEMANLAETLISLQSLKEKVTSPTESVGGPIDVAVITKTEGLIWIKRKHFFEIEKNPRYFMRQLAHYLS